MTPQNSLSALGSAKIVKRIHLARINQDSTLKFHKCLNLNNKKFAEKMPCKGGFTGLQLILNLVNYNFFKTIFLQ